MTELARLDWHGDEVQRLTEAEVKRRLTKACIMVTNTAKENLAVGGASGFKTSHGDLGSLRGSVHYEVEELEGRVGSNLKYARIQELGGPTHPTVTPKMRRWAWAMFYETKNPMYRGVALTKKAKLDIIIPPRSYLRPALWSNEGAIRELFARPMK